jgi:hypothetical protein
MSVRLYPHALEQAMVTGLTRSERHALLGRGLWRYDFGR